MRPKPLEVTTTSLTTCYASLCNSSRRSTYSLYKGLLINYWWCLTSTLWTPSTSSLSTSHLHSSNGKSKFNAVSLRLKHSSEILFIYRKYSTYYVLAFIGNARHNFNISNIIFFFNKNFILEIFIFFKFSLILFDFILFYFSKKKFEIYCS